jgi:hypothetical protein
MADHRHAECADVHAFATVVRDKSYYFGIIYPANAMDDRGHAARALRLT